MLMDSFTFDHLDAIAYYALYTPINNAAPIRQRIVAAATAIGPEGDREREEMNFAFIDASLITSLLHLQTGIHQAILTDSQGALRTKTVHSEILWSLNPTNNVCLLLSSRVLTLMFLFRLQRPSVATEFLIQPKASLLSISRINHNLPGM